MPGFMQMKKTGDQKTTPYAGTMTLLTGLETTSGKCLTQGWPIAMFFPTRILTTPTEVFLQDLLLRRGLSGN